MAELLESVLELKSAEKSACMKAIWSVCWLDTSKNELLVNSLGRKLTAKLDWMMENSLELMTEN